MSYFETEYRHTVIEPFKFWCHKVIPLVYDDSLSYYEVLCKVVNYINNMIDDLNKMGITVEALTTAFSELRDFVEHYFDNLDVQEEINRKLDEMALDGTLTNLIESVIGFVKPITAQFVSNEQVLPLDYEEWGSVNLEDMTTSDFYALYDKLTEDYPYNFTEYQVSGNKKCYRWFARSWDNTNSTAVSGGIPNFINANWSFPTLFLVSGIHGNEKVSMWSLYQLLKNWFAGYNNGDYFTNNFDIFVIPCANPWGIDNNIRENRNYVNLNRNFPFGWDNYTGSDKGTEALSEDETKFIYDILTSEHFTKIRNSTVVIDFHDFVWSDRPLSEKYYMWTSSGVPDIRTRLLATANYVRSVFEKRYEEVKLYSTFIRFNSYAADPTLDYTAYNLGFKGTLCESPQFLTSDVRYEQKALEMSYLINANVTSALSDCCYSVGVDKHYTRLLDIGANINSALTDVCEALPNGGTLETFISWHDKEEGTHYLRHDLPYYGNNNAGGFLKIHKSRTTGSKLCNIEFTESTTIPRKWITTTSSSGALHTWTPVSTMAITGNDVVFRTGVSEDNLTLENLCRNLPAGAFCDIYCSTSQLPVLYNSLAIWHFGVLKITATRTASSAVFFTCDFYTTTGDTMDKYTGLCQLSGDGTFVQKPFVKLT